MKVRYVNYKHFVRGVPHPTKKGQYAGCSQNHGQRAYWTADRKDSKFTLGVRFCEDHATFTKENF